MLRLFVGLAALAGPAIANAQVAEQPPVQAIYATIGGWAALDRDDRGGNPFASALIDVLAEPGGDLSERLLRGTLDHSDGLQGADIDSLSADASLMPRAGEAAQALVIVFADYGDDEGLDSLPGAAFDAARVAAALSQAGFSTRTVIAGNGREYLDELDVFARSSAVADRALIYTTGHGTQAKGAIYLLPPDIDGQDVASRRDDAIPLGQVKQALRARGSNWLLYAGCRDNPFNW